jgi:hypothetical protein
LRSVWECVSCLLLGLCKSFFLFYSRQV